MAFLPKTSDWSDPEVRAAELERRRLLRAGKKYNRISAIPEIATAYKNDPRTQLAVKALAAGSDVSPVAEGKYGVVDGIARALTGVAGGYINNKQRQVYGELGDETLDKADIRTQGEMQAKERAAAATAAAAQPPVAATVPPPPQPPPEAAVAPPPEAVAPSPPQPPPVLPPSALPTDVTTAQAAALGAPRPAPVGGRPGGQLPFLLTRPGSVPAGAGPVRRNVSNTSSATLPFDLASGRDALRARGAKVTSDYRTEKHNAEVGGVANSWHTRGTKEHPLAMDFVPPKGMSMGDLAAHAREAYPGFEVINEGDHVHVEPSDKMVAAAAGGPRRVAAAETGQNVLQGDDGNDTLRGSLKYQPGDEVLPELPPEVARPKRPNAVGPGKSELLQAAYNIMLDRDEVAYGRGQDMYAAGLSEQDKMNEAAIKREQDLIDAEYGTDRGIYADDVSQRKGNVYQTRRDIQSRQFQASESAEDRAARARESAADRASRLQIAREDNDAALKAALAKPAVMTDTVARALGDTSGSVDIATFLNKSFKDEFVGHIALGDKAVSINKVVGGNQPMADWWSSYSQLVNDVRHGKFGSALTDTEKREFLKETVTARTDPRTARRIIEKQNRISEQALRRRSLAIAGKYGLDNVTEAIGRDPRTLRTWTYDAAPTAGAPAASGPLTPAETERLRFLEGQVGGR